MSNYTDNTTDSNDDIYMLRLYVAGAGFHSSNAIQNLKEICSQYLDGRFELEVVDVYQNRELAEQEQLVALPMLLKISPLPARRLVGDMANKEKVLNCLGFYE